MSRIRRIGVIIVIGLLDALGRTDAMASEKELPVLLALNEPAYSQLVSEVLKETVSKKFSLRVVEANDAEQTAAYAKSDRFKVAIILFNNLRFSRIYSISVQTRLQMSLALIQYLHTERGICVIGLLGPPSNPSFETNAKKVGAQFVFPLPFDPKVLGDAVRSCIK